MLPNHSSSCFAPERVHRITSSDTFAEEKQPGAGRWVKRNVFAGPIVLGQEDAFRTPNAKKKKGSNKPPSLIYSLRIYAVCSVHHWAWRLLHRTGTGRIWAPDRGQTCPLMAVTCGLGCGQSMQLKMLAEHEGSLCSERLVACRWQCLQDVKVRQADVSRA